jgi:hypothetical protein
VGVGYNGMPHGCSDDELPWGKLPGADPLDTKVSCNLISQFPKLLLSLEQ